MRIALIPARGGSVGVKLKNIRSLGGLPLISYTIKAALESRCFDRVIVSTDHLEIAKAGEDFGAEIPFLRPKNISTDCPTELVAQHCINFVERESGVRVDDIMVLQPTSPFRSSRIIADAAKLADQHIDCDSVVAVSDVDGNRPEWMCSVNDNDDLIPFATPFKFRGKPIIRLTARQEFPKLFKQNGVLYLARRDLIVNEGLLIGPNAKAIQTTQLEAFDIDTEQDLLVANSILRSLDIGNRGCGQ